MRSATVRCTRNQSCDRRLARPAGTVDRMKVRLDALLTERGLFSSRSRAAAAVMAGEVRLGGPDGPRAAKAGQLVAADAELSVDAGMPFVSRGGVKLANALDAFGLSVQGRRAVDVGASTGGFTDCLLQRGAAQVAAVDVAYGELDWRLRSDPRVVVVERTNARALTLDALPCRPDLLVADVSFISLTKVLPAVLSCMDPSGWDGLVMVKPQFEVGRAALGKGGVVRSPELRRGALVDVASSVGDAASVLGFASSGLPGPKGNRESFLWLAEPGRAGALDPAGVAAAAERAEP